MKPEVNPERLLARTRYFSALSLWQRIRRLEESLRTLRAQGVPPPEDLTRELAQARNDYRALGPQLAAEARRWPEGTWLLEQPGVAPLHALGMTGFVDPELHETAAMVWRYAGLAPASGRRGGGNPRFLALTRDLLYGILQDRSPENFYRRVYHDRLKALHERNLEGGFAEKARRLQRRRRAPNAWLEGRVDPECIARRRAEGKLPKAEGCSGEKGAFAPMLPPETITSYARRQTLRILLVHYHAIGFEGVYGAEPELPWKRLPGYLPPPRAGVVASGAGTD